MSPSCDDSTDELRYCSWTSLVPLDPTTALMRMTEALAVVSQEPRIRTRGFSAVIRFVAKAGASVAASRRPSETANAARVTEMISIWVKAMPFLSAALSKRVGASSGVTIINAYRVGTAVLNCTKKRIVRAEGNEQYQTSDTGDLIDGIGWIVEFPLQQSGIGSPPESCNTSGAINEQSRREGLNGELIIT